MAGGFSAEGEGKVLGQLGSAAQNFRAGLMQASNVAGQVLVRTVRKGMSSGSKSGRLYGQHQASAPGEYSAIRSGALFNSADYELSGANFLRFGVRAPHGVYQELGTSKMGARPNLQMAVDESSAEVRNLLGQITFRRIVGGG